MPHVVRYAGHWCTQNNKLVHIVSTFLFQTLVNYEKQIPYELREGQIDYFSAPKKSTPFLPDNFLSAQRIVLIPINLPKNVHWMLVAIKALRVPNGHYVVCLTSYNSLHKYEAEDIALLHVCANIVEHMLQKRTAHLKHPVERKYMLRLGYAPKQRDEFNECALHVVGHMVLLSHHAELQYFIDTA